LFCVLPRSRRGWALFVDRMDLHLGPRGVVSPDNFFYCRPVLFHVPCCRLFSLIQSGAAIVRPSISRSFSSRAISVIFPGFSLAALDFSPPRILPFRVSRSSVSAASSKILSPVLRSTNSAPSPSLVVRQVKTTIDCAAVCFLFSLNLLCKN
jgi:hypothetical protein